MSLFLEFSEFQPHLLGGKVPAQECVKASVVLSGFEIYSVRIGQILPIFSDPFIISMDVSEESLFIGECLMVL